MVVKKYLCAAPRPEAYEEKAEALLEALGGDEAKREQVVRQTLAELKRLHGSQKRTGPGRRSNAEHAIAFYEYILGEGDDLEDKNGDDDSKEDEEEEEDDGDDKSNGDEPSDEPADRSVEEEKKESDDKKDDASSASTNETNSQTVESMDTQEFLNQHNDECEVCNQPGELLCCSTCSLVFHMKCLRPALPALPKEEDEWSCPHCIIQGVKGYKRHSKVWKAAAAGVRLMGRLRSQQEQKENPEQASDNEEGQDENEKDDVKSEAKGEEDASDVESNQEEQHASKTQSESSKSIEEKRQPKKEAAGDPADGAKDQSPSKKRNPELSKLSDAGSKSNDPAEDLVVKEKRVRRQPALYQPQLCADSRWQSDERVLDVSKDEEESDDSESHESSDDNGEKGEDKKSTSTAIADKAKTSSDAKADAGTDTKDTVWCQFCSDDPSIPVCVFCACRTCYGKHSKDKYLKCRKCEDEYHSFCVGEKEMPEDTKIWLCPSCNKPSSLKVSTRRATTSAFAKGRPSSVRKSDGSVASSDRSSPSKRDNKSSKSDSSTSAGKGNRGRSPKAKDSPTTPSPRKRGRPPKSASSTESSVQRKRGRPPKSSSQSPAPSKRGRPPKDSAEKKRKEEGGSASSSPPRKRGRPPKNAVTPATEVKKRGPGRPPNSSRGPGRPPKSDISIASSSAICLIKEDPPVPPEPVKLSRSGRIVKRQSFHDEVYEGEQHLRTTKTECGQSESHQLPTKLQNSGTPRSKSNESSESRKKQKSDKGLEEGTSGDATTAEPNETSLDLDASPKDEEKEEEIFAPVRMKPVLQPPAPAMRPIIVESKPIVVQPSIQPEVALPSVSPAIAPATTIPRGITDSMTAIPMASTVQAPSPAEQNKAKQSLKPAPIPTVTSRGVGDVRPTGAPISSVTTNQKRSRLLDPKKLDAAVKALPSPPEETKPVPASKTPRRKPGARECMQISRRFGVKVIPEKHMKILLDYCSRGKVEHLIRMRERLDCHSRFLESQIAGLEMMVRERGETHVVVPPLPECFESVGKLDGSKLSIYSDTGGIDTGGVEVVNKKPAVASSSGDGPRPRSPTESKAPKEPATCASVQPVAAGATLTNNPSVSTHGVATNPNNLPTKKPDA